MKPQLPKEILNSLQRQLARVRNDGRYSLVTPTEQETIPVPEQLLTEKPFIKNKK